MKTIVSQTRWDSKITTFNDDGYIHSFNDEPAIIYEDGFKAWFVNDKKHRINGPAQVDEERIETYYLNDLPLIIPEDIENNKDKIIEYLKLYANF